MSEQTETERLREALITGYADLWAHYHSLVRAIGMAGTINDGRLAVDAQIIMEQEGAQFIEEGRRRFRALLAGKPEAT